MKLTSLTPEQIRRLEDLNVRTEQHLAALLQQETLRRNLVTDLKLTDEQFAALAQELTALGLSTEIRPPPPRRPMGALIQKEKNELGLQGGTEWTETNR